MLKEISHPVEFVPSPAPEHMEPVLVERRRYAVKAAQDALRFRTEQIKARTDVVTGLPNRLAMVEELPLLIATSQTEKEPFAIAELDVVGLHRLNKAKGHAVGDLVLSAVGSASKKVLRLEDTIWRIGGDEFLIGLPGDSGEDMDLLIAKRIQSNFQNELQTIGVPEDLHVGISIGITSLRPKDDMASLLERADQLEIRNKAEFYADLQARGITHADRRELLN